jgi:hypothetical protein
MKNLATILLVIALILFVTSSALFMYHFATTENFTSGELVRVAVTGAFACFALIMRFVCSRAKAGIGIFEVTDKDKAQLQDLRREFGLRNILAGLLVRFGGLMIIAAILLPVFSRVEWIIFAELLTVGIFLFFVGILLERSIKR